jgi:hypothetical protein
MIAARSFFRRRSEEEAQAREGKAPAESEVRLPENEV